jgi:transcriptional regulator with XRE-family HTH domain
MKTPGEKCPLVAHVGSALRAFRKRRGLSQQEVARVAGVSMPMLSSWERGQHGPLLESLHKVMAALEVDLADVGMMIRLQKGQYLEMPEPPQGEREAFRHFVQALRSLAGFLLEGEIGIPGTRNKGQKGDKDDGKTIERTAP